MFLESKEGALIAIPPPGQGSSSSSSCRVWSPPGRWSQGEVSGLCCGERCQQLEADKFLLGAKAEL